MHHSENNITKKTLVEKDFSLIHHKNTPSAEDHLLIQYKSIIEHVIRSHSISALKRAMNYQNVAKSDKLHNSVVHMPSSASPNLFIERARGIKCATDKTHSLSDICVVAMIILLIRYVIFCSPCYASLEQLYSPITSRECCCFCEFSKAETCNKSRNFLSRNIKNLANNERKDNNCFFLLFLVSRE